MSRYRLQPTREQETILLRHCSDARYVWNLAVEQHAVKARGGDGISRPVNREPQLLASLGA
jgi:hypothetical protein